MGGSRRRCAQRARRQEKSNAAEGPACPVMPQTVQKGNSKLVAEPNEVVAAVASLYQDELKPFGRILRKRVAEFAAGGIGEGATADAAPDVDIKHLYAVCASSELLRVESEEGGDWSAVLIGRPATFVDVYSPVDLYPPAMWTAATEYFENLDEDKMHLPGGRYSCAQELLARNLYFLEGRSLGQVCHIVQLAISQKKILGYLNGAVVPYGRSQSMMKEHCAVWQRPCTDPEREAPGMPIATWDGARTCLRQILNDAAQLQSPGTVPLSNVKRLFRSRFNVELSETALGHSKLSELLQDVRLEDVCGVRLDAHGYTVVQKVPLTSKNPISLAQSLPLPLTLGMTDTTSMTGMTGMTGIIGPTGLTGLNCITGMTGMPASNGLHPSSLHEPCIVKLEACIRDPDESHMDCKPRRLVFCPDNPLRLEDAGIFDDDVLAPPRTPVAEVPQIPRTPVEAPRIPRWSASALSPSTLGKNGSVGSIVRNTFIHAALPPPTPPPGARRRASSLPKDSGSGRCDWEAACHVLGFQPRPAILTEADAATESTSAGSAAGEQGSGHTPPSPSHSLARGPCSGPSGPPSPDRDDVINLAEGESLFQTVDLGEQGLRQGFFCCPPLVLEDADDFLDAVPSALTPAGAPPPPPGLPLWPSLSPSVICKGGSMGKLVQNTFIHTALPPPTPLPGAFRRSHSLPKDVGSHKSDWETTCHALSFLPRPVEPAKVVSATACALPGGTVASPLRPSLSPTSPAASPLRVPPSPALTASPMPMYCSRRAWATSSPPLVTSQQVLRLAEHL